MPVSHASHVHVLAPDPAFPDPHIGFHAVPGLGELFVIPALTLSGPCDILFWEAVPGGPLDRWAGPRDPERHLALTLELAARYVPWWPTVPARSGSPTPHGQRIIGAAAGNPAVASRFADGFADPTDCDRWFLTPAAAGRYPASV